MIWGEYGKGMVSLGCDFFERVGEKRIDVGTLLVFLFFFFSDGVLCFCHNKCVVFLALVHLQVHVCANRHIDVCTWNPYLHTCNPNLLTSGSLSLSTFIAAATAAATIAVAAAAAAPAPDAATILLPGASFPPLSPLPSFSLLVVDCCLPRRGLLLCFRHTR